MSEIANQILYIVSERANIPAEEITKEKNLKDLGFDSLDSVELIMEIEDRVWVKFSEKEMEEFNTVGDIIELAIKKKAFSN